jgi:murein DD-endopeptidase MepM/ murein hydrolase activator NlpD
VLAVLLALGGWRWASDRRAAADPLEGFANGLGTNASAASSLLGGHDSRIDTAPAFRAAAPNPTPIFATYKTLQLRLPVPTGSLTEVGFHQASYAYALRLKTRLPDANIEKAAAKKGTGRDDSKIPMGEDAWLTGSVLRMWRSRPGRPDTAVDVGAKPGTPIISPVSGTVVKVKSYLLYGTFPDFEIHIQPDGWQNLDVVVIHTTNVQVAPGDRVEAGITQLANVRKLSDKLVDQLAYYTRDGGNHVHVQVNNADYPGYKGLQGAVEPQS